MTGYHNDDAHQMGLNSIEKTELREIIFGYVFVVWTVIAFTVWFNGMTKEKYIAKQFPIVNNKYTDIDNCEWHLIVDLISF